MAKSDWYLVWGNARARSFSDFMAVLVMVHRLLEPARRSRSACCRKLFLCRRRLVVPKKDFEPVDEGLILSAIAITRWHQPHVVRSTAIG